MKNKLIFKYIAFSVILFIGTSCSNNENIPKDIIGKDKMQEVLLDVYLAETDIQDQRLPQDTAKVETKKLYDKILAKHKISNADYFRSLNYYTRHPDIYSKMLQPVIDSLSAMEARN